MKLGEESLRGVNQGFDELRIERKRTGSLVGIDSRLNCRGGLAQQGSASREAGQAMAATRAMLAIFAISAILVRTATMSCIHGMPHLVHVAICHGNARHRLHGERSDQANDDEADQLFHGAYYARKPHSLATGGQDSLARAACSAASASNSAARVMASARGIGSGAASKQPSKWASSWLRAAASTRPESSVTGTR